MSFEQVWRITVRNLFVNKKIFLQTLASFIVGVAGLFTVLTLVFGVVRYIGLLQSFYNNNMMYMVMIIKSEYKNQLTLEDIRKLVEDNPDLFVAFSPHVDLSDYTFRYDGKDFDKVKVMGVSEDFPQILDTLQVEQGRWLYNMDIEREQEVCVVGSFVGQKLLNGDAIGSDIKIQGHNYTVVGVLQEVAENGIGWSETNNGNNYAIYIPYTNAQNLSEDNYISWAFDGQGGYGSCAYYFTIVPGNERAARSALNSLRNDTVGRENCQMAIFSLKQYSEGINELNIMIIWFLSICSLIVLLAGGLGIINMMEATVQERTREIGIRKAFGATNSDIKRQFLLESACIGGFGGIFGILLGIPACYFLCEHMYYLPTEVIGLPILPVLLVWLAAIGLGMMFGSYSAGKAAKMEIVDAINSD